LSLTEMTPDAPRRRTAHDNMYAPKKPDTGPANHLRRGNLAAPREPAPL
jgi:K+-sensing histidine kinase KdpD